MKKQNEKKIAQLENYCLNIGRPDFFEKAEIEATINHKYGTKGFVGMLRRLIDWQEAGILIIG